MERRPLCISEINKQTSLAFQTKHLFFDLQFEDLIPLFSLDFFSFNLSVLLAFCDILQTSS